MGQYTPPWAAFLLFLIIKKYRKLNNKTEIVEKKVKSLCKLPPIKVEVSEMFLIKNKVGQFFPLLVVGLSPLPISVPEGDLLSLGSQLY